MDMTHCVHCNTLFRGRTDKKFCTEKCRAGYNYSLRRQVRRSVVREIDEALKRNRKILRRACVSGGEIIAMEALVSRGFEFKYYTTICGRGTATLSFYCYDMGYMIISDSEVMLIKGDPAGHSDS